MRVFERREEKINKNKIKRGSTLFMQKLGVLSHERKEHLAIKRNMFVNLLDFFLIAKGERAVWWIIVVIL